ncbi:MAG: cbb3-type cytochrome oxidase subunit 3 [Lysobacteraceae bacterium]|jgi:cytochrome c oxidase cbb3-type subunit 4|nr:cbb3-type cytochrome c oxidase subunit 3 [Xanthomonadaceae bacterium]MCZ8319703.1 cbb3-type cytochrome c oxidase subunit 3 [Silanimonas sp.]
MVSGIVTAILLLAFLGGTYWLFGTRRAADFDRIARSPLEDTPPEERP